MKVRHKTLWQQTSPWLVMEESENYYIAAQIPYTSLNPEHLELLPKSLYERIPTDHWQDVTGECSLRMDGTTQLVDHDSVWGAVAQANPTAPYRLRKVQLLAPLEPVTHLQWAFVVEQKVD